ncbi:serine/threonine-protein kinase [Teredinibacter waterburyi]|uniref:serine/threonine-protein kinase n=1 Tax=Teredinibacter waterburyi TaxID=1500538 RepID=UPI001FE72B07|nr:serine/threonine-protein kinase [Teredinibacter waterburyi]
MPVAKLADILARVSLRYWVLVVGVAIALSGAAPQWLSGVDRGLFVASSYLVGKPRGTSDIGLIQVPQSDYDLWQSDLYQAGTLGALLSNILLSSQSTIGLVLYKPLPLEYGPADVLLESMAVAAESNGSVSPQDQQARELVSRKNLIQEILRNDRVVLGVKGNLQQALTPLQSQGGELGDIPVWVRRVIAPPAAPQSAMLSGIESPRPVLDHYTIANPHNFQHRLVVSDGDSVFSGFLLRLLYQAKGQPALSWLADGGVQLGANRLRASTTGDYLVYNLASARMAPRINRMSLDEALASGAFSDLVLIARENDEDAEALAATLFSLLMERTAAKPWWQPFSQALVILLITLLLVFVVPRFSFVVAGLICLLVSFVLLVGEVVSAATHGIWLPMSLALFWLWLGFVLICIFQLKQRVWREVVTRADSSAIDQAAMFIDKGDLDAAYQCLLPCSATDEVLAQIYRVAGKLAEQQDYPRAIATFQSILLRRKSFRDCKEKIEALAAMRIAAGRDTDPEVDATQVIDRAALVRPALGRYELKDELGRGSTGIVYLGFDPRIARQVAIKTLNYRQFQQGDIADIKARFFREAEAAGRLNHPNIVSVFDVGDDADLAYIAMDYVEGKALNAFVDEKNLLPVFEVYRIIADVASALEYAHSNHIVHRDIKPGNIIYNPSPYQLKVTDFGIARLVDNSRTSTGEILGSPLYMAPEQLLGRRVQAAADVFSLGVTFYQLLTGRLPFNGDSLASLSYDIIHGKHKGVRSLRKELPSSASRITNQCLQKDPDDRYETAADLAAAIKKAIKRDFVQEARRLGYV